MANYNDPTPDAAQPLLAPADLPLRRRAMRVSARWVGLQDKLLLSTTLLITATLLGSGAAFVWYTGRQVRQVSANDGSHVAAAAAVAVAPLLQNGDCARLAGVAREMLVNPQLRGLAVYDGDGVALAAWMKEATGEVAAVDAAALPGHAVAMRQMAKDDAHGLDVLLPVYLTPQDAHAARPAGFVGLTLTEAPAMAYVQRTAQVVAGGGLGVLAVVLPIMFILVNRAFAPIRRLGVAARNVAEGRFETVDIARGDALGVLAETFNHMVLRLAEQKRRADEAHARLIEANLELEHKVAERTGAIEAATHRLAGEIAEKEDFLRAISHDLNAPLRNIDGMVTMVLRKHGAALPEEVVRRLERIKKNVEHEAELINELLELSRIKTRREQLEVVNVEEMLWELRGLFENDLREHHIDLVIESRLPPLHAERGRMRQVFQNLIDNAIKYMGPSRERRITVGARVGRSETEFWVRDTGQGIAPEDMGKVFYVFRRGRNGAGVAGKGVGLASVKSIIENYNGTIWAESEPGRGSTFRFTVNARFVNADARLFAGSAQESRAA